MRVLRQWASVVDKQRWLKFVFWLSVTALASFLLLDRLYPLPDPNRVRSVLILAEDGTPLQAFADAQGVWRYPTDLAAVSPLYIEALLSYEDRWFYYHFGINPLALLRAFGQWLGSGEVVSGGSTLTMQVARILDPHSRSLSGKLWQMFRALQLEWHYSKDEILSLYLNFAPFGGTIEGVQTASYAYLHKPAQALSHAEAALLAVLPQAPSRLRPDRYPQRAQHARDKVLNRLYDLNVWNEQTVTEAKQETVVQRALIQPKLAPHFARRMKAVALQRQQASLTTTIDAGLQWRIENILRLKTGQLPPQASASVLVMDNLTGAVRAYVGSVDFFANLRAGQVDMVSALRSPGSTLKPFLYGMAMDAGLIHSGSLLSDVPLRLQGYAPRNFMRHYKGPVSAAEALQLSLNIPAVDLLQRLTPAAFDARLRNAGLALAYPAGESANLSLILGGAGAKLEQLVQAYSALGRGGISLQPRFTAEDAKRERYLLSPEASWITTHILQDVQAPTGFSAAPAQIAWKTGTSYGFRDAWALGYNANYTVGVWTGRPDGTPLPGRFGAQAAGPILFEVFQALPAPRSPVVRPSRVQAATVCWPLGGPVEETPIAQCQQTQAAWVIDKGLPPTLSHLNQQDWSARLVRYWVNPQTGLRVTAACSSQQREQRQVARWPVDMQPWLSISVLKQMQLPAFDPSCPAEVAAQQSQSLRIQDLDNTSVLKLNTDTEGTTIELKALGGSGRYLWLINGELIGADYKAGTVRNTLHRIGRYQIRVLDDQANFDQITLSVQP